MAYRKLQESIDKRSAAVMELERRYRIAVSALHRIAKPALGGKQQQYDAQQALKDIGEQA